MGLDIINAIAPVGDRRPGHRGAWVSALPRREPWTPLSDQDTGRHRVAPGSGERGALGSADRTVIHSETRDAPSVPTLKGV